MTANLEIRTLVPLLKTMNLPPIELPRRRWIADVP